MSITYNFEYKDRLKACFIGAGGHSFRNIYPTFQYAPIDLVAICDLNEAKAEAYASQFGANNYYTNYHEMFAKELPEVVFIVASYHANGRVQATDIAKDALKAGIHVRMEKPTAATTKEIKELMTLSKENKCYLMTGLKQIFMSSIEKVKSLLDSSEFGTPSSLYISYPERLPTFEERQNLRNITGFLDHIFHPGSIINYLMGKIESMFYQREPHNGGCIANLKFSSGSIGTLHLAGGIATSSPLEYLE